MKQSTHPHGITENKVSVFIDFKRETNFAGHVFSFERKTCAHCFKWLGDSPPVFIEKIAPVTNSNKRIVIEIRVCEYENICHDGQCVPGYPLTMDDSENIVGEHCQGCRYEAWVSKNIFPYTSENLGACQA